MKPSKEQYDHIYTCWKHSLPPMKVAKQLQLVPLTVIKEYVRLDEQMASPTMPSPMSVRTMLRLDRRLSEALWTLLGWLAYLGIIGGFTVLLVCAIDKEFGPVPHQVKQGSPKD